MVAISPQPQYMLNYCMNWFPRVFNEQFRWYLYWYSHAITCQNQVVSLLGTKWVSVDFKISPWITQPMYFQPHLICFTRLLNISNSAQIWICEAGAVSVCVNINSCNGLVSNAGIILCMRPSNERRRYNVTSSPIGWAHANGHKQLPKPPLIGDLTPMSTLQLNLNQNRLLFIR